ncbi:MFS transporter [Sphingopyxis sp. NFH-91]|uniref:MFS transporter n=1 Tax=Sphingopyxis sp. NFH-91 TaxID=2744457 RepID=UPI001F3E15FC|nr:MFS transporter [Sphingopyxis sp. NFH-91]
MTAAAEQAAATAAPAQAAAPAPSALASERAAGEWRKSWHLVLLTAIALTCSPATLPVYTIGVLTGPLHDAFGWGRGTIQAAILFSTGLGMVGGPLAGWMIERLGLRRSVLLGVTGLSAAVAACASITGAAWQLYLFYGLMALLGAGTGAVSWTYLIVDRFEKTRGLALGIALSGTGIAAMLMPRIAAFGLDQGGWQASYLILGAYGLFFILPLCALLLPRRVLHAPGGGDRAAALPASGVTLRAALRRRHFWLLGAATFCIYVAVGGLIPTIVPALTDAGLSTDEAVSIMGFFGLAIIVGRILIGSLVDHIWAPAVAACVLVPAAAACFAFQLPLSFGAYALAAMLIGMATGMELDMLGFLATRYFGLAHFAPIYGRLYMFVSIGAGSAPLAFGSAYDWTGSYALPISLAAGLLLAGAAGLLALGRYPDQGFPDREDAAQPV